MMRLLRGCLAAALALSAANPAQASASTPGRALADAVAVNPQIFSAGDDPYPPHPVGFPGGVVGWPDLTYQILPRYRPTKLDLYLPPATFAGPRPVIVFVHGGGWAGGGNRLSGAFANFPSVLAMVAARGYVVAAVSYRFSGETAFPGAIQDVKAAIRWLRTNADKYRIDRERFAIFGGSAGGQLAALAATSCGAAALEPPAPVAGPGNPNVEKQTAGAVATGLESDCVQAAVAWYGVFDFRTMPGGPNERWYLGCGDSPCTAGQQSRASAVTYLNKRTPPMLVIAGSEDKTVPPQQTVEFHSTAAAQGLPVEMLIIPGVDHSFIGHTADATRDASRLALARTFDFIDRAIGHGRAR